MITRKIQSKILNWSQQYPVVTILGPRQSGKTTLVKSLFPNMPYINLEDLQEKEFATSDPKGFLDRFPKGAVLDEIQNTPQLLSQIQVMVDHQDKAGQYILTGSNQIMLSQGISQSLAGRTAIAELLPFQFSEIKEITKEIDAYELIFTGFYPRVWDKGLSPREAYGFYLQTYVERDLRQILAVKDLVRFQTFLKLLAGRTGQLLNLNSMANDTGIATNTAKEWLSVLEASFLVFRLQPFHANLGKRLVKSPKVFFWDPGIICYLLGIQDWSQISTHPLRGQLFENFIIADMLKGMKNVGEHFPVTFYRDSNGVEADLLIEKGIEIDLWEIKSGKTFVPESIIPLQRIRKVLAKTGSDRVIYGDAGQWERSGVKVFGWKEALLEGYFG